MKPVRMATSKPARQTYLNTILFMIASGILLCLAAVAYVLFYLNYVPQIGIEKVIHLQYGYVAASPSLRQPMLIMVVVLDHTHMA